MWRRLGPALKSREDDDCKRFYFFSKYCFYRTYLCNTHGMYTRPECTFMISRRKSNNA